MIQLIELSATHSNAALTHRVVSAIDASQLYYWSTEWRCDQARAEAELSAGQGRSFDTGEDAIHWLMGEEER